MQGFQYFSHVPVLHYSNTGGTIYSNLNNFHEYLVQHSLNQQVPKTILVRLKYLVPPLTERSVCTVLPDQLFSCKRVKHSMKCSSNRSRQGCCLRLKVYNIFI